MKGRNEGKAEDRAEKEGQGQRKGLRSLTDEDSPENYMLRSVGKLHKKLNSQKKHLIQKEPSMSDDFLLQCQILLRTVRR